MRTVSILLVCAILSVLPHDTAAQGTAQARFATPDEAIRALAAAARTHDTNAITRVLGAEARSLSSGDAVLDAAEMATFAKLVDEKAVADGETTGKVTFLIGEVAWPFAIPLVREGDAWYFDTKAGADELLSRRIGEAELSAIALSRAYALAQWEYFTTGDWDSDGVAEYAQNLTSTEGKRDGLYWPLVGSEKPSPLGGLVSLVGTIGYTVKRQGSSETAAAVLGYRFKILMRQGPSAPGGRYDYVINGNMIGGYALLAYPDTYGRSGVMSFIVNQQGRVYQKDLGPSTATAVAKITAYDPDPSWSLVDE